MQQGTPIGFENVRQLVVQTLPPEVVGEAIFGGSSALDSLGLVNFLADLEYRIAEIFGRDVVLASERAMSRSQSPFRDVTVLAHYIVELLSE